MNEYTMLIDKIITLPIRFLEKGIDTKQKCNYRVQQP